MSGRSGERGYERRSHNDFRDNRQNCHNYGRGSGMEGRDSRGSGSSYGRGRDGRGRGRGDGGRGNKNAGQCPQVSGLLKHHLMGDDQICRVINPSMAERQRASITGTDALLFNINRKEPTCGLLIKPGDLDGQIVSNYFDIPTESIPEVIYSYSIFIYKRKSDGEINKANDLAKANEEHTTTEVVKKIKAVLPACGIIYDGKSILFSTMNISNQTMSANPDVTVNIIENTLKFSVRLNGGIENFEVELRPTALNIETPNKSNANWSVVDAKTLLPLEGVLMSFARWDSNNWFIDRSKVFRARGNEYTLDGSFVGMKGYHASLKSCKTGLVMISDMTVACFAKGGRLEDLMYISGDYRTLDAMLEQAASGNGIPTRQLQKMLQNLKGLKIRFRHINIVKKIKNFGPPCNSSDSRFNYNGNMITIEKYFSLHYGINLNYPYLPSVKCGGSKKGPLLLPVELIEVIQGQTRNSKMTSAMVAEMIKIAAVKPLERFQFICDNTSGQLNALAEGDDAAAFGLSNICMEPKEVAARLLPPPRLQYDGNVAEPNFSGGWFVPRGHKFIAPPREEVAFAVIVLDGRQSRLRLNAQEFANDAASSARNLGIRLKLVGICEIPVQEAAIVDAMKRFRIQGKGLFISLVILPGGGEASVYNLVKKCGDVNQIITQCVKREKASKTNVPYFANLMLKINAKLGGLTHKLVSRERSTSLMVRSSIFQDPPASLCWILDEPTMLVGIDLSHPEPGQRDGKSIAAVVASMDGSCGRYAAHINIQEAARSETLECLEDAMRGLLHTFNRRNGSFPKNLVIFRDGVGDGMFPMVKTIELSAIRNAVNVVNPEAKISVIVCQKRHNSRFVYKDNDEYINPCPGLVFDSYHNEDAITSVIYNEFFLNSHVAIQGTAKPCRYNLLHDEIGFKICELELLVYWSTYLYCRCTKSVSVATPAYYAHWAAKRGRALLAAGASIEDINNISSYWQQSATPMFFV